MARLIHERRSLEGDLLSFERDGVLWRRGSARRDHWCSMGHERILPGEYLYRSVRALADRGSKHANLRLCWSCAQWLTAPDSDLAECPKPASARWISPILDSVSEDSLTKSA